ncbi:hypothetical protein EEL30_21580 [Brevibacillus laterosporus]|uniref:Uncharacterized protein n=1 Tax=Brevibacillus laterosporus TaxID=1465 RepID=A0A518VCB4_BRELA|nr:hypothetical protein EEL30_21580 [Brevibacillus laterosporus]
MKIKKIFEEILYFTFAFSLVLGLSACMYGIGCIVGSFIGETETFSIVGSFVIVMLLWILAEIIEINNSHLINEEYLNIGRERR